MVKKQKNPSNWFELMMYFSMNQNLKGARR